MAREHIDGLLTTLHEKFTSSATSPEQEELLRRLQSQLQEWDGPRAGGDDPSVTAELLAEELDAAHPHLSAVLREVIAALGRIGI